MSAFTLLFTLLTFTPNALLQNESAPCYTDIIVLDTYLAPNITCSQCISTINTLKNETAYLSRIAKDIEYVCGKIFGPAAHECVEVTEDIREGLNYLASHNSTQVCRNLHYCK